VWIGRFSRIWDCFFHVSRILFNIRAGEDNLIYYYYSIDFYLQLYAIEIGVKPATAFYAVSSISLSLLPDI
jgi:hypothetical protein